MAKLPNADRAVIAPDKLRDYLLNPGHRRGASKAKVLLSLGYRAEDWQRLEADLRRQHASADVAATLETEYGVRYEIAVSLAGPNGRTARLRSIWQIDTGTDCPRLITMIPE